MKSKIETSYGPTTVFEAEARGENQGTVFIAPGFGERGTEHFKELAEAVSEHGFRAITFDQPHKNGGSTDPLERRAAVARETLTSTLTDGEKAHLVGHSLGAHDVLLAALENPDLVSSVTLLQPSGLTEAQSLVEVGGRVGKKVINNQVGAAKNSTPLTKDNESRASKFARITKSQIAGGNALAKSPSLALKEANAARQVDITELMSAAKEQGIAVNLITSEGDELYESDQVEQWINNNPEAFTSWSMRADKKANHDNPWIEHKTTAHVLADVIRQTGSLAVHEVIRVRHDEGSQESLVA